MLTDKNTDIRLPLGFILVAIFSFVVAQIVLFFHSEMLTAATFRIPEIWSYSHIIILGFAMMVAMGAMYQLVPVVFLTPIWNQSIGFVHLGLTSLGVVVFSALLVIQPTIAIIGAIFIILGCCIFFIQMFFTLRKAKFKNMLFIFVMTALGLLLFTIIAGFFLAYSFATNGLSAHEQIFYTHILLGVAGWFTLLIFGFSYKLVPMFSLSHGFSLKPAKYSFLFYVVGLVTVVLAIWFSNPLAQTTGFVLLAIGFFIFSYNMWLIYLKRLKRKVDKPFLFSLISIIWGNSFHVIAVFLSAFSVTSIRYWGVLLFGYLMCWIVFTILGYLYKIVPFLWWTKKYADDIGNKKVPTLKDLINEKLAVILFSIMTISMVVLLLAIVLELFIFTVLAQALFMLASIVYASSIIQILFK